MGDFRIFDLEKISKMNDALVFVETGTFKGDGVRHANSFGIFEDIHSIEILDSLAEEAKNSFQSDEHINIHHGDSVSVLTELLPSIKSNAVFWLDAHFPGADLGERGYNDEKDAVKRIPLEYELKLIQERCNDYDDILIIDDAWLYVDADFQWGTMNDHMTRFGHNTTREELGAGKGADFIYENFAKTHDIQLLTHHQGYFIVIPKTSDK